MSHINLFIILSLLLISTNSKFLFIGSKTNTTEVVPDFTNATEVVTDFTNSSQDFEDIPTNDSPFVSNATIAEALNDVK